MSFGSADYARTSIDWNKMISGADGSGTAFRLNAVAQDGGVAGRDFVKNKRWAIAPSLAIGLNTPTRIFLDYVHVKQDNVPDGGVPTIGLPGYSNPDPLRARRAPPHLPELRVAGRPEQLLRHRARTSTT